MPVIIKIRYDVKKIGKSTRYKSNVYTNSEMPEAFYFWIRNWYATLISNDGKSTENKYKNIPTRSSKMRSNERKESCGCCLSLIACLFNIPFICCIYYERFPFEKHTRRGFISMKWDDLNSIVFKKNIKCIKFILSSVYNVYSAKLFKLWHVPRIFFFVLKTASLTYVSRFYFHKCTVIELVQKCLLFYSLPSFNILDLGFAHKNCCCFFCFFFSNQTLLVFLFTAILFPVRIIKYSWAKLCAVTVFCRFSSEPKQ